MSFTPTAPATETEAIATSRTGRPGASRPPGAEHKRDQAPMSAMMKRQRRASLFFLIPAAVFLIGFVAYPVVYSGFLSFFEWNGLSDKAFVGFDNFTRLMADPVFWSALGNNVVIAITSVVFQVAVAIVIAYCLVRVIGRLRRFLMFLYIVPVVISEICIGLLWGFVLNPYFGLSSGITKLLGLGENSAGWLGDRNTAFWAIILVMSLTYVGLYILLFVAAIQNVDEEIYEAAELDGAGAIRQLFSITIPAIWDNIQSVTLLCVISSFKTFSLVWVLTGGGPGHATDVVSTYLYKTGFNGFEMGYASTMGFVQMILTAIAGVVLFGILRKVRSAS